MSQQHKWSRSSAALILSVAAMLLGACSTNREVTKPEPVPVTTKLLAGSLLTTADLPSGWIAEGGQGDPISAEVIDGHDCDDPVTQLKPKHAASAGFSHDGVELTDTAAWFPGQGRAAEQAYRDVVDKCRQTVLDDRGLSIRTAALDFGVLSDNTLPIRIEIEPTSGPIVELDLIVMRRGDLLHVIRLLGPRPSDKALLDAAVRAGLGRLGRIHQDTT